MVRFLPSDSPLDRMLSYYLADRVQYGAVFHLVMVAFFALGTDAGRVHRSAGITFAVLLACTGIARFMAARARLRCGNQQSVPTVVNQRLILAYLSHTVVWNLYTAYVLYFCFGDLVAESILIICIAGTTSSATIMLAASATTMSFPNQLWRSYGATSRRTIAVQ